MPAHRHAEIDFNYDYNLWLRPAVLWCGDASGVKRRLNRGAQFSVFLPGGGGTWLTNHEILQPEVAKHTLLGR